MTLLCSSPLPVICAENIALLYLLHSVPVPPSCNDLVKAPFPHEKYSLSFAQERNLASTLAFLSNTKGDPNYVPALCVEENTESASLSIMLAVNRAKWEDGNQALGNLKQSFDKIFVILSEISDERYQSCGVEHRVFTAIVSMCFYRILRRLRFAANDRGKMKQPLKLVLGEAVSFLKKVNHQTWHNLPVEPFTARAKDVVRLADSWAKHQTVAELEDLVEGIYQLKQVGSLQALMDSIPNRDMCPSSRQNLLNIVSKVSRYREAARFLYHTAKRVPLLRRAKVVIVSLPEQAFHRHSSQNRTPELSSTISRASAFGQGPDLSYLCRLLNTTSPQMNDQFNTQTRRTLREAKIHAEIQLIFHYELNAAKLPPRVICSSKDACFLCNAFIMMHGKMHMPRYHGRLYPGWRLPLISGFDDLNRRFNSLLEREIGNSLRLMSTRRKKTTYPDPNESTLLTLPLSISTLRTSALAEASEQEESSTKGSLVVSTAEHDNYITSSQDRTSFGSPGSTESLSSRLGPRNEIKEEESSVPSLNSLDQPLGQSSLQNGSRSIRCDDTITDTTRLVQGLPLLGNIAIAREPEFHTTGTLEIHIECVAEAASSADESCSEMSYSVEWISDEEAKELLQYDVAAVVDVATLRSQVLRKLCKRNGLLIMAGGVLVRIAPRDGPAVVLGS